MYSVKTNDIRDFRIWQSVLAELRLMLGEVACRNWFDKLSFGRVEGEALFLGAPTRFIRDWVLNNYFSSLLEAVNKFAPEVAEVVIGLDEKQSANGQSHHSRSADIAVASAEEHSYVSKNIEQERIQMCEFYDFALDPKYTFSSFVVGDSNALAFNAAMNAASGAMRNSSIKTLYIHSDVGMGKTHLLQSIAAHIRENESAKVLYLSAERFMHLFLKSLKSNQLIDFKERLKSCDILVVDDLQFICGKNATASEFANILTALSESNKVVVVAADVSPFQLNLENRSKSRLIGGLVVDITPPDFDLRLQILESKCASQDVDIPANILQNLAKNITSSVRELEGALNKLVAHATLQKAEMDHHLVKRVLKENYQSALVKINLEQILKSVCKYFNVDQDDLVSKSRLKKFAHPRQIAAYLMKELTNKSYADIGKALGNRDHASIIYFTKQIENKLGTCEAIKIEIEQLKESIAG